MVDGSLGRSHCKSQKAIPENGNFQGHDLRFVFVNEIK